MVLFFFLPPQQLKKISGRFECQKIPRNNFKSLEKGTTLEAGPKHANQEKHIPCLFLDAICSEVGINLLGKFLQFGCFLQKLGNLLGHLSDKTERLVLSSRLSKQELLLSLKDKTTGSDENSIQFRTNF